MNTKKIKIDSEFIKLDQLLKYASLVQSGAEAKMLINDEQIIVNGEICTMRGKKLRPGDTIEFEDQKIIIE
ncbi:RNA-binding S4 domain-containing protein [Microaceticoccus formicicus]|uniref:RNA-binding S4 domain-containing protein n=1 Tax=Microaceticoccus formicicus TaxID=3118105 RepID=UPI003CD04815|nr:RNA-binding S4 domain-containing protein [Peptoniphilaceae bacterium AMB_02]